MARLLIVFAAALTLAGCTRMVYVPTEQKSVEYVERVKRDSVFVRDSVVVVGRHDTVFVERWRYVYRDRLLSDTVSVRDSVSYPVYVDVVKRERYVPRFFRICFALALATVAVVAFRLYKKIKGR